MSLSAIQFIDFGGVDSRSNPLALPVGNFLRCKNFVPRRDHLQLRDGYSTATMTTATVGAIHSMVGFEFLNSNVKERHIVFAQGTVLKRWKLSDGSVAIPTVRGAAIASGSDWSWAFANGKVYGFNGTDKKNFDGSVWRDTGLRKLTSAEVSGVTVTEGIKELTSAQAAAVTLTAGATGTFETSIHGGRLIYVALFDISNNQIGPATISVGPGRVTTASGQKITVGNLPNLSAVNTNWVKLIAGTGDGDNTVRFFATPASSFSSYTIVSNVLSIFELGHGLATGDVVAYRGTPGFDGIYAVTVVDADHFTCSVNAADGGGSLGNVRSTIAKAANAATSKEVISPTQDSSYRVNHDTGLAASVIGGAQPGYQFYASIYNIVTGGIGNCVKIGNRLVPTTNGGINITGLPNVAAIDSEWRLLLGRTADGDEVPYAVADADGNWIYADSGVTAISTIAGSIDNDTPLPQRSDPPQAFDKVIRIGNRFLAALPNDYRVFKSGSDTDAQDGKFVGNWEEAWSANDMESFPTGEDITSLQEYAYTAWCFSLQNLAILVESNGAWDWQGPWEGGGCPSKTGFTKTPYGPVWFNTQKQLVTMTQSGPVPISDEYEAALLARIGDAYVGQVQVTWERDAAKRIDRVIVKGRDSLGIPLQVYHDFKLRAGSYPWEGKGYESAYLGQLAADYWLCAAKDANGVTRQWAGAPNGYIYHLDQGLDDIGNNFTADGITLLNAGTDRPKLDYIEWYGDQWSSWSIATTLDSTLANYASLDASWEQVPGGEHDYQYRVSLPEPEIKHVYVRLQLTSHPSGGFGGGGFGEGGFGGDDLGLNDPPHVPLENYGRIWMVSPLLGPGRGH